MQDNKESEQDSTVDVCRRCKKTSFVYLALIKKNCDRGSEDKTVDEGRTCRD